MTLTFGVLQSFFNIFSSVTDFTNVCFAVRLVFLSQPQQNTFFVIALLGGEKECPIHSVFRGPKK
jgi:hypothetical protein